MISLQDLLDSVYKIKLKATVDAIDKDKSSLDKDWSSLTANIETLYAELDNLKQKFLSDNDSLIQKVTETSNLIESNTRYLLEQIPIVNSEAILVYTLYRYFYMNKEKQLDLKKLNTFLNKQYTYEDIIDIWDRNRHILKDTGMDKRTYAIYNSNVHRKENYR